MNRKKVAIIVIFSIVVLSLFGYAGFSFYQKKVALKTRLDEASYSKVNSKAYIDNLLRNDPKPVQDSFEADIEMRVNDKFTKSDAYFITHRYFDNGGNIYEIFDYVESHPNLAFLKEAESIRPDIFNQIRNKTLTQVPYSTQSLYAVLAYLEILDKYGYADLAALGTLANQYAKTAYFIKKKSEGISQGPDASEMVEENSRMAIFYELKAKESIEKTFKDNGLVLERLKDRAPSLEKKPLKTITGPNLLVGMNQYAAALRYLEVAGTDITVINSPVNASDIFAFNMALSKQFIPELEIFTSLLNASTLSLVSPNSADALKIALQPILDFDTAKTKPMGIVLGIMNAKDDKFTGLDIYSKKNIKTLGNSVPEFKTWLITNGWTEKDFLE